MDRQDWPSYLGQKNPNKPSVLATGLWAIILATAFVAVMGLIRAFVVTKLWGWFVLPTFPSVPDLSIPAAWGIAMLVGFLTYQASKTKEGVDFWAALIFLPITTLLGGWIVQFWM